MILIKTNDAVEMKVLEEIAKVGKTYILIACPETSITIDADVEKRLSSEQLVADIRR